MNKAYQTVIPLSEDNIIEHGNSITIDSTGRFYIPKVIIEQLSIENHLYISFYSIGNRIIITSGLDEYGDEQHEPYLLKNDRGRYYFVSRPLLYALVHRLKFVCPAKLFPKAISDDNTQMELSADPVISNTPKLLRDKIQTETPTTYTIVDINGVSKSLKDWKSRLSQLQDRSYSSKSIKAKTRNRNAYIELFKALTDLGHHRILNDFTDEPRNRPI